MIYPLRVVFDLGWGFALVAALIPIEVLASQHILSGGLYGAVAAASVALLSAAILLSAWPARRLFKIWFALLVLADLAAMAAYVAWRSGLLPAAPELFRRVPGLARVQPDVAVAAVGLCLAGLLTMLRRRTAMGMHPRSLAAEFPDPEVKLKFNNVLTQLREDLDRIDGYTRWSASDFIALDAEVEVFRGDQRSARVIDLMEGLVRNRDRQLFIVLGDPGSGKSVALRKLARNLLQEAKSTGRIPIYINLKEWQPETPWTQEKPPTTADLMQFIRSSLRRRQGLTSKGAVFLDASFEKLAETGRLFLIFDSFDEIPQLLDIKEAAWLINALSHILTQLIAGTGDGRGIIASRLFRQPEISRKEFCRLDIRPLSDEKSQQLIARMGGSPSDRRIVRDAIFHARPDLAAAGRNPLLLTLLVGYVHRHNGRLPPNQHELFHSHMEATVRSAIEGDYKTLKYDTIWSVTEKIAMTMFNEKNYGLDMPLSTLRDRMPDQPVERIATFLVNAKLGRESQDRSFSFVHRRFNEFFLVRFLLEDPERAANRALTIADDGRWRDALALYVEVAPPAEAVRIAEICMAELRPLLKFECVPGDSTYMRGVHSLRFLNDSFKGRTDLLQSYSDELERFITSAFQRDDLLVRKNAVETVGLLQPEIADGLLARALTGEGDWVKETAFRACRYMRSLTSDLLEVLRRYLFAMSAYDLLSNFRRLSMLFSLSESLRGLRANLRARAVDCICAAVLPFIVLVLSPKFFIETLVLPSAFVLVLEFAKRLPGQTMRLADINLFGSAIYWLGGDLSWISLLNMRMAMLLTLPTIVMLYIMNRISPISQDPGQLVGIVRYTSFDLKHPEKILNAAVIQQTPMNLGLVTVVLTLLVLPYGPLSTLLSRLRLRQSGIRVQSILRNALILLVSVIVFVVMMALMVRLDALIGPWLDRIFSWAKPILRYLRMVGDWLPSALIAVLCSPGLLYAYQRWTDMRRLREAAASRPTNRRHIAEKFEEFRTGSGRHKYVQSLWNQAADLEPDMRGSSWPDGRRPNHGDDAASNLLARLDERWLGLAR